MTTTEKLAQWSQARNWNAQTVIQYLMIQNPKLKQGQFYYQAVKKRVYIKLKGNDIIFGVYLPQKLNLRDGILSFEV